MGKTEAPQHLVVGHLNKAHGTKGEIFVWPLTDHPGSTFVPGVVLYLSDKNGDLPTDPPTLRIDASRAYRRGFLVHVEGVQDRPGLEGLLDRYVMRSMAQLGAGPHRSGDIAHELEREVQSIAPTRSKLIVKGMVWSPSHGDTAFTGPLFDEFMCRIMPGDDWRR